MGSELEINNPCGSFWTGGLFSSPVGLQSLLDQIPLGIAVLNLDREIVLVNRAMESLTGFLRDDVSGLPCASVVRSNVCIMGCPFALREHWVDTVEEEGDIINRDHQKIPVRMTFARIWDANGRLSGFIETLQDIRAIKQSNDRKSRAYGFGQLLGHSGTMERVFSVLPMIAQSDSSVLITGETGTGKDLLAETIHQASERARNPFIKVNCGALPETLMESELFGHQKGAFTGAFETRPGRFRLAHNGTLYLTEIGDLPMSLQVKLLTFLDDKIIYPLGSAKGFRSDVRVIAATHRNLEQMVREGRFREDLLFRLNVVRIHLPPLRQRGDDTRLLLDHFLHTFIDSLKKPINGFSAKALKILTEYEYPGNVRELKNIVEYAVNVCQEDLIHPKHLPAYLTEMAGRERSYEDSLKQIPTESTDIQVKTEDVDWSALERKMILDALLQAKGRRSQAANILGWGRSTLWRKMKHYRIASQEK